MADLLQLSTDILDQNSSEPDNKNAHGARGEIYQRRREQETSPMAKGIFGYTARESQAKASDDE
jgi:hypothetical protein